MKPVEIIGGRSHRYSATQIQAFLSGLPAGEGVAPPPLSAGNPGLSPVVAEPPPPAPVFQPPAWRANETPEERAVRIRTRLANLKNLERRELCALVLEGKPFAKPGKRDETLNQVASILAFIAPEAGAEEILDILKPSLDAMRAEANEASNPAPTNEDALDKITRKLVQAREAHALQQQVNDRIRAVLMKEARRRHEVDADREVRQESGEDEQDGEYTTAELDSFAAAQDCSPDEFARRWIIQRDTSYYVFCRGNYMAPLQKESLDVSLDRDLAPVPAQGHPSAIDWNTWNKDGNIRRKKVAEILKEYSTVAREVIADLTLKKSYYDPNKQTFFEAACPVRDLKAKFDEQIDEWLRHLGGDSVEKLLDWIATIGDLRRQTCALYLSGVKGAGKTMLATGLARIWTAEGAPTEIGRILDNFNSDLMRCPLILADEHIQQNWRGQRNSAELRQLIGSNSRTLSRKFLPNATLVGAVRLILAANNGRLLALDEDLSKDDLEAVGQRFLHIEVPQAAAAYLEKIGGRTGTEGWVDGDKIAKHALWLAQNRKVVPGNRFLVEGHRTKLHAGLPTQSKTNGLIVEWLVRVLDAPPTMRQGVESSGLVLIGDGKYLVNTQGIVDSWEQYIKSDSTPTTGRVGRALKTLSTGTQKVHDSRFHEVDLETVFTWATENQIGREDHMRALVNRPLTDTELAPVKRQMLKVVTGGKSSV